jgi:hypothetical protein
MVLSPTPPNETEGSSGILAPFGLVDLEKIQNSIYFMAYRWEREGHRRTPSQNGAEMARTATVPA